VNRLVAGQRRLVLLYWSPLGDRSRLAVNRHLRALRSLPGRVVAYNAAYGAPRWLGRIEPDGLVLHTTFLALRWLDNFEQRRERSAWIADLGCPKLALPQDDYDHAEILDEWLEELQVDAVLTALPEDADTLLPRTSRHAEIRGVLTGYLDDDDVARLGRPPTLAERPSHVVYRATRLPFWFGHHGLLKQEIGTAAEAAAGRLGLTADVSTRSEDAILGPRWLDFLASGRAVVGVESGSSALDRRGELRGMVRTILKEQPGASFQDVARSLPPGWDDHRFFALSPRHLEAAAAGTAQVLVEGTYSGVLEAGRHYLPIRTDLSDLDSALEETGDPRLLQRLADTARKEIGLSGRYSYRRLTAEVDDALQAHGAGARSRRNRRSVALAQGMATAQGALELGAGFAAGRLLSRRRAGRT
jgi:hypothetical protein